MRTINDIAYLKGRKDVVTIDFLLCDLVQDYMQTVQSWLSQNGIDYKYDDGFEELFLPSLDLNPDMLTDHDNRNKLLKYLENDKIIRLSGKSIAFNKKMLFEMTKVKFETWLDDHDIAYEVCESSDPCWAWREIYVDILAGSADHIRLKQYLENEDGSEKFAGVSLHNNSLDLFDFRALIFFTDLNSKNQPTKYTDIDHVVKFLVDVDNDQDFDQAAAGYETFIQEKMVQFDKRVVLVGESSGEYFAAHFAKKLNMTILLITPSVDLIAQIKDDCRTRAQIKNEHISCITSHYYLLDENHYYIELFDDAGHEAAIELRDEIYTRICGDDAENDHDAQMRDKHQDPADLARQSKEILNDAIDECVKSV